MGIHNLVVQHGGESHELEYDSDEGEEVLKCQLFSLTNVPPENQNLAGLTNLANGLHTLTLVEENDGVNTLKSVGGSEEAAPAQAILPVNSSAYQSDEDLARALQMEEDAIFAQQQQALQRDRSRLGFEGKLQSYLRQVMQYEDPLRQNAARNSVPLVELDEKAMESLAEEGNKSPSDPEKEYALLLQLLFWFKKSFKWINEPDCDVCGSKSDRIGMGNPTPEELRFGGNRVELFRCRGCKKEVRFARYNDPLKLLETRSGRCGEYANCFTLYCRALGYQSRLILDFTDHVWAECFVPLLNRWIHLDPCEGEYDKPLLYEEGWKKKLTYVIALANDGVYDVTRRYTRKWNEVLSRRTEASESTVQDVVAALTARARLSISAQEVMLLNIRDQQELEEILASAQAHSSDPLAPGRQSGARAWRVLRGEAGDSQASSVTPP